MLEARLRGRARRRPARSWSIDLRARDDRRGIASPNHRHLAVGKQRRRMLRTCGRHRCLRRPRPGGRENLRRVEQVRRGVVGQAGASAGHQHFSGRKEGCRVPATWAHGSGGRPRCRRAPIVDLSRAEHRRGVPPPHHEHPPVREQRRGVLRSPRRQCRPGTPSPRAGRVQLRGGQVSARIAADQQYLAVREQCRGGVVSCRGRGAGRAPGPTRRVVELGGCHSAPDDEHLPCGQEGRRVTDPRRRDRRRGRPATRARVVELDSCDGGPERHTAADDEHLARRQQGGRVQ